ncbi:MAG: TRAP transporter substrate-binding protein DctP [Deinococcota bacterium]|nr:TRAP transporter substrate-binding protein DctP [Deinococcota bacterium]
MKRGLFSLSLVLCLSLTSGGFAQDQQFNWIVQSVFPLNLPLTENSLVLWAEKVEAMSNGRLTIQVHGAGEVVPAAGVFESVRDGVLDAGLNTPAWQKGEFPAGDLFYTLPGGVTEFHELLLWMYGGGGKELQQEMYGDLPIVVFPLGLTPPESGIWTNRPIESLDDFRGLTVRGAGLGMELLQELGASAMTLSAGDTIPALQRGVVDAAEFADPGMDYGVGLHEVAQYLVGPPIHMGPNMFQLAINRDRWEELPDDLKAIVEAAALAATMEGYVGAWMESIEAFGRIEEYGTVIQKLSPEEQTRAHELALGILERESARDAFFGRVWQSQKDFLESYSPYYNFSRFNLER